MRRLVFIAAAFIAMSFAACGGFAKDSNEDEAIVDTAYISEYTRPADEDLARYKLYPTTNMWTFLKLDTRTGQVWQVQWSLENQDNNDQFEYPLSTESLVSEYGEPNGRFELYPTTNDYNFIMLDRIDGNTYQVQWSIEDKYRFIEPISGY